ncbi:MAG: hypothetical protein PVJ27_06385, partial [Candidatus Brocadiaceae bacterium]
MEEREETDETRGAEAEMPEPAPTDLRRNIWLLVIIFFVVLLAWVLSLLSAGGEAREPGPEPERPGPAEEATPPVASATPQAASAAVLKFAGTAREAILASPPRLLASTGTVYRRARLFDVS